jgi:hypothetical protein
VVNGAGSIIGGDCDSVVQIATAVFVQMFERGGGVAVGGWVCCSLVGGVGG